MRISDWSSDVCSSDLVALPRRRRLQRRGRGTLDHAAKLLRLQVARHVVGRVGIGDVLRQHLLALAEPVHALAEQAEESGLAVHSVPGCSVVRSEEHTSELQSLMRISYAVFCLKKKRKKQSVNR